MINNSVDPKLYNEVAKFGAMDMEICMQCGACSASCPLSEGNNPFPRKIYRYLQLGLKDKLLKSSVPWLCYYCGECNKECPRGAEPAETMMAVRRWLTTQYDWTGLAKKLYLSTAWEIGALASVALFIVLLFVFFHGPIITDHVSVNTFAPVIWIEIGDLLMATILSTFLLSNAFRMFRYIMGDTNAPFILYIKEAKTFILNFATQKRWSKCSDDKSRWVKHFILVTGYLTMMTLIIICIRWFQVDDSSWHFTSIFGYYATAVLLFITVEMFLSRMKKQETIHRYSELSDWLFLILLFLTTLTGIMMHIVRLAGWPMGTYVIYVIHLAIAVPMLVIEVPFGKWSHMFYRPLALFLSAVKDKASKASDIDIEELIEKAGETFMVCQQCGTCTSVCPVNLVSDYSPRRILRKLAFNNGTQESVENAAWDCLTCNTCGINCPRGIDIIEVIRAVRTLNISSGKIHESLKAPLDSLKINGNPWNEDPKKRIDWTDDLSIASFTPDNKYCLFTCCTTAYTAENQKAGRALSQLMDHAGVNFGTLGNKENCCSDIAHKAGADDTFSKLITRNTEMFLYENVKTILATSPHCLNSFKNNYPGLKGQVNCEHYTELLERLILKGRLTPFGKIESTVTYHDPCYLGRYNNIYEAPRRILQSIPGLKLVEMGNNREGSICCGGFGTDAWNNYYNSGRKSNQLGMLRIEEALDTGAEMIVTACPFCVLTLNDAVEKLGVKHRITVTDPAQLLLQSVNTVYEVDITNNIKPSYNKEVVYA
ncbi:MAG: 4Fe-4S dicluster domain-containing protein [Proteobacteria bacterium]|nr:4Fe-4S dicluster domain-containing protein [Pseudomonadota bacterium]